MARIALAQKSRATSAAASCDARRARVRGVFVKASQFVPIVPIAREAAALGDEGAEGDEVIDEGDESQLAEKLSMLRHSAMRPLQSTYDGYAGY